MKGGLKILAWVIGAVVLVLVALSVAAAFLIDPNDYRGQIEAAALESTGRQLRLDDELGLKVFPCCALTMGRTSLSNPAGFPETDFAKFESAALSIRLWPLITAQEVRIGTATLEGLQLDLITLPDGTVNWTFESDAPEAEAPDTGPGDSAGVQSITLDGVALSNARIRWLDEQAGDEYLLENINLQTGAIEPGQPFDVSAEVQLIDQVNNLVLDAGLTARPKLGAESGDVDITDTELRLTAQGGDLPTSGVDMLVNVAGVQVPAAGDISISGLSSGITVAGLKLRLDGAGVVTDDGPEFAGTFNVAEVSLRDVLTNLGEAPPRTSDPAVLNQFSASGSWQLVDARAALEGLQIVLDDTRINGALRLSNFETQAVEAQLAIDTINLDRYMAPAEEGDSGAAADSKPSDDELPVEALRDLNLDAELKIQQAVVADARLQNINLTVSAHNGIIRLNPLLAELYGGTYAGDIRLDARGSRLKLSVNETLAGVSIGGLLKDAADTDNLSGIFQTRFVASGEGQTVDELIETLNGDMSLQLDDAVYEGVDLWYSIRAQKARLEGEPVPPEPDNPQTQISDFKGTATFADGVLRNDDFLARIPFIQMGGKGTVNIIDTTLDYQLKAKVVSRPQFPDGEDLADLEGLSLPIRLKGPAEAPEVTVDLAPLLKDVATKKLTDRLLEELDDDENGDADPNDEQPSSEDQLKKSLKKLLGG
ncbi:MAG: AsmA family protein [Gammaproteobacteria bacterium]